MISVKALGSVTLLFLVAGLASAAGVNAKLDSEGCRYPSLVDYGAPLRRMAPIHRPPGPNRQLPHAPRGVTLEVAVSTVQTGRALLALAVNSKSNRAGLGWTVDSRLSKVRKSGAVVAVLRSKRQRLNAIQVSHPELSSMEFAVGNRPGFYRMDSTLFDSSGRRLGSYAEYFRVLKPRTKVRESVSPTVAHGGDVLVTSTENFGTTSIGLGNGWAIERYEDGEWVVDPVTPKGFAGIGIFIFGGVAYECHHPRLPTDMSPGQYRFHKVIELFRVGGPERDLYAEFVVEP